MHSELPHRVPEKPDALTPDLPPFGPDAPDITGSASGQPRRENPGKGESSNAEQTATGPAGAKPQEPTD